MVSEVFMLVLKRFRICLAVLLLAIAAACGGDGEGDAGEPAPSAQPSLTAILGRGGQHGPGVTETEILLGMTNDLLGSGDTPYGVITTAIQAYFRKANEEDGGVCQRALVLRAEDDRYAPEEALIKTKKLVEQDNVLAMIGSLGTRVHVPSASYLSDPNADGNPQDGVPDLFVSTGWSGWGDVAKYPWTVGYVPDYVTDARVLTRYLNDNLGDKKLAVLHAGDDLSNDYLRGVEETIDNKDLLVSVQQVDPSPENLKARVTTVRDAGAEVVLLALPPELSAAVYRTADAEGYAPKWLLSYVNSPSALAREIGGGTMAEQLLKGFEELQGSVSTEYLLSAIDHAETPPLQEHKRIMETYGGPTMSTLSIYGQSLAEAVIETLARTCETITRETVRLAAESLSDFRSSLMVDGISVNLSAQDHFAIQSLQVVEIQGDGTLKNLGDPISVE
jgi:branched-chain amino acid transport system substrate-binding protein